RLQLREDQQVHTLPAGKEARGRLARVLGYRDNAGETALAQFDTDLRRHQSAARQIHERLFFRPLLEAFAAAPARPASTALPREAVAERLAAFGFADAERTHQAVLELTRGLSRSSRLMQQMLPLLLDWLSGSSNPDLGLLGLRKLATGQHCRDQLTAVCRESPEAARQLCQLLGTGPRFARDLQHHPDLLQGLATGDTLAAPSRSELDETAARSLVWREGEADKSLRAFVRVESLRIASRDVLDLADVDGTGQSLTNLAESVLSAALRSVAPAVRFAVVGMGRLGGRELAYSSDLDLLFVYENPAGFPPDRSAAAAESAAAALVRLVAGNTPANRLYRVDTALRPEGRQGPQARSIEAYAAYYERWAQTWERQALLKGRVVAGDEQLGARFEALASEFVWGRSFGQEDVREVRRTKARIERERVPASEDPKFHLKLGPGSLSDIEWTVQLLQLQHGVRETGTLEALRHLVATGVLEPDDGTVLIDAYRFCERTRNRLQLVHDGSGDALPATGPQLTALARSFSRSAAGLRDEYLRRTRRCRQVVERLFYGREPEPRAK
ncbi:MAG: putative nucleotidyltransferase substrate binding domain-containing protein, partial [Acidimicrobiales bacterium]